MSSKGRLSYDRKVKRFRDAQGRFVSYDRGIRSAQARKQYRKAPKKARYVPPAKKLPPPSPKRKIKKKKRKVRKAPPPTPSIYEVAAAPGQQVMANAWAYTLAQLAALILSQIKDGVFRFRFWYRLPEISAEYPLGIGSTQPLLANVITKNNRLSEVKAFLNGRKGYIKGKVTTYWFSRRKLRYDAAPEGLGVEGE